MTSKPVNSPVAHLKSIFFSGGSLSAVALSGLVFLSFLGHCGTEVGNPPQGPKIVLSDQEREIRGVVQKGPVADSTVSALALDVPGKLTGTWLASTRTDANGVFELTLPGEIPSEGIVLIARGGHYTDEASGEIRELPEEAPLRTLYFPGTDAGTEKEQIGITPLTEVAVRQVEGNLASGSAGETPGGEGLDWLFDIWQQESGEVAVVLGLGSLSQAPESPVKKIHPALENQADIYMLLLSGLSQLMNQEGAGLAEFLELLRTQLSENIIVHQKKGKEASLTGQKPEKEADPTAGPKLGKPESKNGKKAGVEPLGKRWKNAIQQYLKGPHNNSGLPPGAIMSLVKRVPLLRGQ